MFSTTKKKKRNKELYNSFFRFFFLHQKTFWSLFTVLFFDFFFFGPLSKNGLRNGPPCVEWNEIAIREWQIRWVFKLGFCDDYLCDYITGVCIDINCARTFHLKKQNFILSVSHNFTHILISFFFGQKCQKTLFFTTKNFNFFEKILPHISRRYFFQK